MKDDLAVHAVGLTKSFSGVMALDNVTLAIRDGEFFSLLGSSGSGKSTLLRIIGGFVEATAGSLSIHGRDVLNLPPHRRPTNMVFQQLALFPHMNVFDNIAFGLQLRKLPASEVRRKVEEFLALVRLEGFASRAVNELSGGQRQRVAIARALINEPEVLLLDEPLSALDLKLRQQMQVELRRIQKELGSTFIFVTHDQGEAITMSDRIAVMSEGRIVQVGSPREVYGKPANKFVAGFIGDSNFMDATIVESSDAGCRVDCEGYIAHARQHRAIERGARVSLAVRYENVIVRPESGAPGLYGRIVDIIYMGNLMRIVTRCHGSGRTIWADTPINAASSALVIGQDVRVAWPDDAAVALTE